MRKTILAGMLLITNSILAQLPCANFSNVNPGQNISCAFSKSSKHTDTAHTRIRLVSEGTLGANQGLLWVLDGKIIQNADAVPLDAIADVKVVKSEEASALFGSAGAYGAILLTSKQTNPSFDKKTMPEVIIVVNNRRRCRYPSSPVYQQKTQKKNVIIPAIVPPDIIKIYPNPVSPGQPVNISLVSDSIRHYQYQLLNALGDVIQQGEKAVTAKSSVAQILIPGSLPGTVYFIKLVNDNKQIFSGRLVVR